CTRITTAAPTFAPDRSGASKAVHRLDASVHRRRDADCGPWCKRRHQRAFSRTTWSCSRTWSIRLDSAFRNVTIASTRLERAAGDFQRHNVFDRARYRSFDDAGRKATHSIMADSVRSWIRI